ncbi:MAG: glycosyl hydrolase family protein, partial [Lentisphaerae bacterium]
MYLLNCHHVKALALWFLCALGLAAGSKVNFPAWNQESELRIRSNHNSDPDQCRWRIIREKESEYLSVTLAKGKNRYPGIMLSPAKGLWDYSGSAWLEAVLSNPGSKPISLTVRADNPGGWKKNPWSAASVRIAPGKTATARVYWGYAFKRKAYPVDPARLSGILIYANNPKQPITFHLHAIKAGGHTGDTPPWITRRIRPENGVLWQPGRKGILIQAFGGSAQTDEQGIHITPPKTSSRQTSTGIFLSPGKKTLWNLSSYLQVEVHLTCIASAPTNITLMLENKHPRNGSNCVSKAVTLAPNQKSVQKLSFIQPLNPQNRLAKDAWRFSSADVTGLRISIERSAPDVKLIIHRIEASTPAFSPPDWLGERPPVAGEWIQTFNEDFNTGKLDESKWNCYGPNYWDKKSHWSRQNLIFTRECILIRYEKKHGYHNDAPDARGYGVRGGYKESDFAGGYLDTFGKWRQRYGYFEARMKLPTAPGLWPAFWMMPDRGPQITPVWKRTSTHNGGMEFDIMEHLTRWGPHRYNVAMHWDGYQKEHKAIGSGSIYVHTDREGFITAGLLWLPGKAVFYCNGREVARYESPRISTVPAYMMFTLPQGGWDNAPLDITKLPDDFVIDYVRVWQSREFLEKDGQNPP